MKKRGWMAILLGLILAVGVTGSAWAADELPAEIGDTIAELKIIKTAYWDGPGSTWFVLARTPYGANMLLCYEQEGGCWIRSFHTVTAVPQGEGSIEYFFITDRCTSFLDNQTRVIPGPFLVVHDRNGSMSAYQRNDSGEWKLYSVFWQEEQVSLEYTDEGVDFRTPVDQYHDRVVTVQGHFERDLRKVDLTALPKTPRQAEEMLIMDEPDT